MRLIDADELPTHKFQSPAYLARKNGKIILAAYQKGWNDAIDAIVDNEPTIDIDVVPLIQDLISDLPQIVDRAVQLYIEERKEENE